MSNYIIEIVNCKKIEKEFLNLPKKLYKDDDNYVTPLDTDIENVFSPSRNKMFDGGEAIRYMVKDTNSDSYVGRIAAFYNNDTANQPNDKVGGCGFFESINDQKVAYMLFDVAIEWLKTKGMTCVNGPVNFGDREMWWGLLTEGFVQPIYGMNYNFAYYQEFFESYGFKNYFNGMSYKRTFDVEDLNPIIQQKAERLSSNPAYCFRYITKDEMSLAAEWFYEIYKRAWAQFDGVATVTKEQAYKMMDKLKPIIDRKLIYFAFHEDKPIGFFIMVPEINSVIKPLNGKLNFINKLRFIYSLKFKKVSRIAQGVIFGVIPEFRGKSIESGLMNCFVDEMRKGNVSYQWLELAWVGDFNPLMMSMVQRYIRAKKIKNHITYRYNFDREREFERAPRVSFSRPE